MDLRSLQIEPFFSYRPGVVVTHNMLRPQSNVRASLDLLPRSEALGVFLGDFLYESLGILHHRRPLVLESRRIRSRRALELRMESILSTGTR